MTAQEGPTSELGGDHERRLEAAVDFFLERDFQNSSEPPEQLTFEAIFDTDNWRCQLETALFEVRLNDYRDPDTPRTERINRILAVLEMPERDVDTAIARIVDAYVNRSEVSQNPAQLILGEWTTRREALFEQPDFDELLQEIEQEHRTPDLRTVLTVFRDEIARVAFDRRLRIVETFNVTDEILEEVQDDVRELFTEISIEFGDQSLEGEVDLLEQQVQTNRATILQLVNAVNDLNAQQNESSLGGDAFHSVLGNAVGAITLSNLKKSPVASALAGPFLATAVDVGFALYDHATHEVREMIDAGSLDVGGLGDSWRDGGARTLRDLKDQFLVRLEVDRVAYAGLRRSLLSRPHLLRQREWESLRLNPAAEAEARSSIKESYRRSLYEILIPRVFELRLDDPDALEDQRLEVPFGRVTDCGPGPGFADVVSAERFGQTGSDAVVVYGASQTGQLLAYIREAIGTWRWVEAGDPDVKLQGSVDAIALAYLVGPLGPLLYRNTIVGLDQEGRLGSFFLSRDERTPMWQDPDGDHIPNLGGGFGDSRGFYRFQPDDCPEPGGGLSGLVAGAYDRDGDGRFYGFAVADDGNVYRKSVATAGLCEGWIPFGSPDEALIDLQVVGASFAGFGAPAQRIVLFGLTESGRVWRADGLEPSGWTVAVDPPNVDVGSGFDRISVARGAVTSGGPGYRVFAAVGGELLVASVPEEVINLDEIDACDPDEGDFPPFSVCWRRVEGVRVGSSISVTNRVGGYDVFGLSGSDYGPDRLLHVQLDDDNQSPGFFQPPRINPDSAPAGSNEDGAPYECYFGFFDGYGPTSPCKDTLEFGIAWKGGSYIPPDFLDDMLTVLSPDEIFYLLTPPDEESGGERGEAFPGLCRTCSTEEGITRCEPSNPDVHLIEHGSGPASEAENLLTDGGFELGLTTGPSTFRTLESTDSAWTVHRVGNGAPPLLGMPYNLFNSGGLPAYEGDEALLLGHQGQRNAVEQSIDLPAETKAYSLSFAMIGYNRNRATVRVTISAGDRILTDDFDEPGTGSWAVHSCDFTASGRTTIRLTNIWGDTTIDDVRVTGREIDTPLDLPRPEDRPRPMETHTFSDGAGNSLVGFTDGHWELSLADGSRSDNLQRHAAPGDPFIFLADGESTYYRLPELGGPLEIAIEASRDEDGNVIFGGFDLDARFASDFENDRLEIYTFTHSQDADVRFQLQRIGGVSDGDEWNPGDWRQTFGECSFFLEEWSRRRSNETLLRNPGLGETFRIHWFDRSLSVRDEANSRWVRLDGELSEGVVDPSDTRLIHGDANNDGRVDISDGVFILTWLFLGGPPPSCLAAADANGSAQVDIADPQFILNHLFLGGPAPVAPFPDCGASELESDEVLGCEESSCP